MLETFKVNSNGFIEDKILISGEEETDYITEQLPEGIHIPKWDGNKWVEGIDNEQLKKERNKREEENRKQEQTPTPEERIEMLEQAILFLSME